jgi:hypothetical protein
MGDAENLKPEIKEAVANIRATTRKIVALGDMTNLSPEEQRAAHNAEYLRTKLAERRTFFSEVQRAEIRAIVDARLSELGFDGACPDRHRAGSLPRFPMFRRLYRLLSLLRPRVRPAHDLPARPLRENAPNSNLPCRFLSDGFSSTLPSDAKAGGASSPAREGDAA